MPKYSTQLITEISNNTYRYDNLNLTSGRLNDSQAIDLAKALKNNHYIKAVFLSDNKIGDDGIKALALVENIEILTVDENSFGSAGVEALSKSKLIELDISNNNIGDSISFFSENTTLKELDASGCKVTSVGATRLAKGNSKLEILYLEHNKIDDEGAEALMQMGLTKLNLSFNNIANKNTLKAGSSIKELYTRNNPYHFEDTISTYNVKDSSTGEADLVDIHRAKKDFSALGNHGQFSSGSFKNKEPKEEMKRSTSELKSSSGQKGNY